MSELCQREAWTTMAELKALQGRLNAARRAAEREEIRALMRDARYRWSGRVALAHPGFPVCGCAGGGPMRSAAGHAEGCVLRGTLGGT